MYVRMCPYTRVCYPHTCVHTCTNFVRVYVSCFHMLVQFVCVRVCVLPSEMECVLFYSRKIAHRANVICCIMYPSLNKFYLILSYLTSLAKRAELTIYYPCLTSSVSDLTSVIYRLNNINVFRSRVSSVILQIMRFRVIQGTVLPLTYQHIPSFGTV